MNKEERLKAAEAYAVQYLLEAQQEIVNKAFIAGAEAEAESKWISVEDSLPEIGIKVLIFRPSAEKLGDEIITIDYLTKCLSVDYDGIKHFWNRSWSATHWQPLPQPPLNQQ